MTPTSAKQESGLPKAQAVDLRTWIAYQPGAVVSRTLHKHSAGTITLFAFDEGQGLSEHSAPFDAFIQVLEGDATLTIGGNPVCAHTGEAVLLPADIAHSVQATKPFKMLLTMIRG